MPVIESQKMDRRILGPLVADSCSPRAISAAAKVRASIASSTPSASDSLGRGA
jgi:hypothetical protein